MNRVLIIYKYLPQYRVDFYERLRSELIKYSIELHLIYGKLNNENSLRNDEVDLSWATFVPNKSIRVGSFELIWQPCFSMIRKGDIVIVQQENKLLLNYLLMLSRSRGKFKFAFWGHVRNMQASNFSPGNIFRKLFVRNSDWWFVYTDSGIDHLEKINFPKQKISVVHNSIDTDALIKEYDRVSSEEIEILKSDLNINSDNVAIYCGGLYPEKDIEYIIEVCKLVRHAIPDFFMIFIGAGVEMEKVKTASEENSWILYVGNKFNLEKVPYFKIASIQIMPRLVGLAIIDSFALSTPLVTTNHPFHGPEIDYLENGKNGLMVQDDFGVYVWTIVDLLRTKNYAKLLPGCMASARKYSVQNMVSKFSSGILQFRQNQMHSL